MEKNILVCTVECWDSKSGADTFPTILKKYSPKNIANISIRDGVPENACCSRYFQISEQKVIKSIFNRNIKTGKEYVFEQGKSEQDIQDITNSQELYNKNRKKRSYLKLFIRELIWKLGVWRTKELDAFLDDFKPDIVLFCMGGYIHFNRICRYVVKKSGAKAVGYFWDDNFTYTHLKESFGHTALRFFQRISLKKLAKSCSAFWAITDKTKQEVDEFFGVNCEVLTKPITFKEDDEWRSYNVNTPIKMLYTGNLLIGRFAVIKQLSKALEKVNKNGKKIELDIYTATYISEDEKQELSEFVNLKGTVTQEEVLQLQKQADILLFVEALSGSDSKVARLSFSTKITDYLYSGKCIFAIGAADVAPMEYLKAQDAAIIATSQEEMYSKLVDIIENPEIIMQKAKNAFDCGKRNHNRKDIEEKIEKTFLRVLKDQND